MNPCPSCAHAGTEPCYDVDAVPAHSCLLMDDRKEALAYPGGDIRLRYCPACGFVFNAAFDPGLSDYSPRYEETQHFSARFNQFAYGLVDRLVRDYDLRKKKILEIGCGKGEFLALLCERGNNDGIGVDPTCHPERINGEVGSRITWIRDYYSEEYRHLKADAILCRHTLEHIAPVEEFVSSVRRSIGDRDTLVFFEVPDVGRVLRERAFWDIYYEHCSYFSLGSLARLFRRNRFEICELAFDFEDQYLLLMARPSAAETEPRFKVEKDLVQMAEEVESFRAAGAEHVNAWREKIRALARAGRRPVLWGASSKSVGFLTTLGVDREVECVVDINPFKHGKFLPGSGHEIVAPNHLKRVRPGVVVIMNPIYRGEIGRSLEQMGIDAEILAL